jgi:triacylglycerol lipase
MPSPPKPAKAKSKPPRRRAVKAAEPAPATASPVVLVHGLARTSRVFWRLRPALRRAGFTTVDYDYPSTRIDAQAAVEGFRDYLHGLAETTPGGEAHFVGYSLGALLIRGALESGSTPPPISAGRIVMIGPPNNGTAFLSEAPYAGLARRLFGPAIEDLAEGSDFVRALSVPKADIGIIAGTGRFHPVNPSAYVQLLRGTDEPHDGTVELRNTKLDGETDFVEVRSNHTFLCADRRVIQQTVAFLRDGRFEHG